MHFYLGVAEWGKEKLIKTTCNHIILTNLHPRTAVCITVQEMQDGGTVSLKLEQINLIKN
jgi:flagellar basal body rod protein FlgB